MYLGEQIINPTENRLRLSAQLGVESIVVDTRPNEAIQGSDGSWDVSKLRDQKKWIEGFDLRMEVLALDVGSMLLDSLYDLEKAKATAARCRRDIVAAGEAGIPTVKYNVQMVGITRTGFEMGRGGIQASAFRFADYNVSKDRQFSYWGVGHPGGGRADADIHVNAVGVKEAVGQVLGVDSGGVTEAQGWEAIEFLVNEILPTAERAGVRLAAHPHDPAFPVGGLNNVNHVVGSLDGMRRFISIAPESRFHGFNFCQGTVAEMSNDPNQVVVDAIREFGPADKIFMVHFRNIKGGYLDFCEAFPDDGDVDMAQAVREYRKAGYKGLLCPDHVPVSDLDPARERFFAFALGYTKALLQAFPV